MGRFDIPPDRFKRHDHELLDDLRRDWPKDARGLPLSPAQVKEMKEFGKPPDWLDDPRRPELGPNMTATEVQRRRDEFDRGIRTRPITYKPGFDIWIDDNGSSLSSMASDLHMLCGRTATRDSTTGEPTTIQFRFPIPPSVYSGHPGDLHKPEFKHWLRETIMKHERHECDEWLRIDNVRVQEPRH